jgi:hypothetical protein
MAGRLVSHHSSFHPGGGQCGRETMTRQGGAVSREIARDC